MVERPLPAWSSNSARSSRASTVTAWSRNWDRLVCMDRGTMPIRSGGTYWGRYTARRVNNVWALQWQMAALPLFSDFDTYRSYCGHGARLLRAWRCSKDEAQ